MPSTKKEFLIEVLKKIEPHRSLVTGFLALLESPLCTQDDIDQMFDIFQQHINAIQDQETKTKIQKVFEYMKSIQEKEQISREQDEKDIDALLASLGQI